MPKFRGTRNAFGGPGGEPHWSPAAKQGIGTAASAASRIWFTIWNGMLTEVYYPSADQPQLRAAQFLFADGDGLLLDEAADLEHRIEPIDISQGYRITSRDHKNRLCYAKEIISDPRRACVLLRTQLQGRDAFPKNLRVYFLCAPHLDMGGQNNDGYVVEVSGRELLAAEKNGRWLVAGASCRFAKLSCGYAGTTDGFTDLKANRRMTFEFDEAKAGNIVLTGELDLQGAHEFTTAIAFGETMASAVSTLLQSLGSDYSLQRRVFVELWRDAIEVRLALEGFSCDGGKLYRSSYNVVLSHEDKLFEGAFVASLTTPWGEARNDRYKGGYHLVWARDMVQSALGLLAAGNRQAPLRVLIYLAARQQEDGGFAQNFWVDGTPFRNGQQLDEVAFPIMLAWRLKQEDLLASFDASEMVRRAINFLLLSGPVTGEERWEEAEGYSPSTLAAIIAACICAAAFERQGGQPGTGGFLESYADFLLAHLEEWTVNSHGCFVRLYPAKRGDVAQPGNLENVGVTFASQPPGQSSTFPASEIVDAGFLQLVRYGILPPNHPVIVRTVQEVDRKLKTITPAGPCWRRYNHDGYGQRPDGSPYDKWGKGRSWPLLTGERAHYELARGGDYRSLIQAIEAFGGASGLLPEQIWDEPDLPQANLRCGGPTGSAAPLVWAHSEYLRLLRSCRDGNVFDLIPEVAERYGDNPPQSQVEFWLPVHPITHARKNCRMRVCGREAFRLRWTADGWTNWQDSDSQASGVGTEYVDIPEAAVERGVEFTFWWKGGNRWDGRNYRVETK